MFSPTRCLRRPLSLGLSPSAARIPPVPDVEEWRKLFPWALRRRDRALISRPETARTLARAFLQNKSLGSGHDRIVIEAFPGPGMLSRAMLELPSSTLRKLIILEEDEAFLKQLKPLEEADPRVTVVPMSGHDWDTYAHLEEQGLMKDVVYAPWEENAFPNLHFVAHLTHNVKGEQLLAQLFRSIPERSWLFRYGRVPMSILMSHHVWSRLSAPAGSKVRCKLGVIGEATADTKEVVDPEYLSPYDDHFYPPSPTGRGSSSSRKVGQPMHAITSIPYAEQVIQSGMIDEWDYCLRRLFVLKSTKLADALNSLAPGAKTLIDSLAHSNVPREQRVNVNKKVRELNIADWALILRAFNKWPFKPQDLMITDAFASEFD
ncbi:S-adenosyl-L-methionine-dependent methyltransferase [Lentinus tigrinus ALCF2SS1-7]|uniref:rRNA adenine N(6)-methyltransferase n=1 Tax=Lentinus tigrinus ALCF2SS1-6 TaxID=1328759 RepID=A0A5C2SJF8_9APHY|nr:S-adenosyl-L-methionine-dependent methyltransferase [Lentinus tigrinus ALCF2SS1-6]RPD78204.1 S-adenosyl-L-methionine-dependent methyltransferase [Lentinus tigrinus ALCF2SS1-7]